LYSNGWLTWFVLLSKNIFFKNRKVILLEFNVDTEKSNHIRSILKHAIISKSLKNANLVTFFSKFQLYNFMKYVKLPDANIAIIPEPFAYGDKVFINQYNPESDYVVFAGRTNRDTDKIIEITKHLNFNVKLIGILPKKFKKVNKNGFTVESYNSVNLSDFEKIIRRSAAYINLLRDPVKHTGVRTIGVAMSSGIPVISTDAEFLRERWSKEICYLPSDCNSANIDTILLDKKYLCRLSEIGFDYAIKSGSSKQYMRSFEKYLTKIC
jgi:glycosyltransferase involved in cell wall biosynthesis